MCEENFQKLKEQLTSAPNLTLSKEGVGFTMCCDTFGIGLGAALMQEGMVIAYASRQLEPHSRNYPACDLELVAMVFGFKLWKHYLYGTPYENLLNHRRLQYFFNQWDLNIGQQFCLELLKDYNLTILYHSDKANVVTNALTKKSNVMRSLIYLLTQEWPLSLNTQYLAN